MFSRATIQKAFNVARKEPGPANQLAAGQGAIGNPVLDSADGSVKQARNVRVRVGGLRLKSLDLKNAFQ